jgi:hypothetical protein
MIVGGTGADQRVFVGRAMNTYQTLAQKHEDMVLIVTFAVIGHD